jgi:hypothetical protein
LAPLFTAGLSTAELTRLADELRQRAFKPGPEMEMLLVRIMGAETAREIVQNWSNCIDCDQRLLRQRIRDEIETSRSKRSWKTGTTWTKESGA